MATPTAKFIEIAARYGNVDPEDIEAVQRWFAEELPKLSPSELRRIFEELLRADGERRARRVAVRVYPEHAPLPSLSQSPAVEFPLLAGPWRQLHRRLLTRLLRGRAADR
jgi:hypothetical protein